MNGDQEFDYVSEQFILAHQWLKSIKKCNCELDETSDDCRHIRKALNKLYGKQIQEMFNNTLKKGLETISEATGFKISYSLNQEFDN